MGAWKNAFLLQEKTMPIKFLVSGGGGVFWVFGRGGVPILFLWRAGIFLKFDRPHRKQFRFVFEHVYPGSEALPKNKDRNLEAQKRYFVYRAMLPVIVLQNMFVLVFLGYRTSIARDTSQNGVSH